MEIGKAFILVSEQMHIMLLCNDSWQWENWVGFFQSLGVLLMERYHGTDDWGIDNDTPLMAAITMLSVF